MGDRFEKKTYEGRSDTVVFEAGRCLHAAENVHRLPEVFDMAERPWIQADNVTVDRLAEVRPSP
ncbi:MULTISPECIES: (4Fe-4S)-binding protein [Streptomyces]|uniref:(4Fe-4S)-binding protein n=1 Tax=Streptomyces lonegramiae TaxID=3075524 RepID=A0ABU2XWY0_9ACTN|nr:(4Fe-4S)-binding protein [Streptomyces sp. DSM 41529]MDT0549343.1 (4Fe-4S)-binding protein [Streptomyces sp. DSM 41529]